MRSSVVFLGIVLATGEAPWERAVSTKDQDKYCQLISRDRGSFCIFRANKAEASCFGDDSIDCSKHTVFEWKQSHQEFAATREVSARGVTSSRTMRQRTVEFSEMIRKVLHERVDHFELKSAFRVSDDDPCVFGDAIPQSRNTFVLNLDSMRACVERTQMSHWRILWTLHNLYYGVAETYSFTDMVTQTSQDGNRCGFKVHEVSVDLVATLKQKLAFYDEYLKTHGQESYDRFVSTKTSAFVFHSEINSLFNRLHDAHTFYASPFDMFRIVYPVTFGSRMDHGHQVITCRYSPQGQLSKAYKSLFGKVPLSPDYNGEIVTHINGMDALMYLVSLVEGPLAHKYQQREQRLNGHIFHANVLAIDLAKSLYIPPSDIVRLRFANGFEVKLHLMVFFGDKDVSIRSLGSMEKYINSNPMFSAFYPSETDRASDHPVTRYPSRTIRNAVEDGLEVGLNRRALLRKGVNSLNYQVEGNVIVVQLTSFDFDPRTLDFLEVYRAARSRNVQRILFDVTGNPGGKVASAYALLWYVMSDSSCICAPVRKRMTKNWKSWIESFGDGLEGLINRHLLPQGEDLADSIDSIFRELEEIINLIFDGLGLTEEDLGPLPKEMVLDRLQQLKALILVKESRGERAAEIIGLLRTRSFLPKEMSRIRDQMIPGTWSCPFDPNEVVRNDCSAFSPPLSNYLHPEKKRWGGRSALYSQPGGFSECHEILEQMTQMNRDYDPLYWKQIAFLSDGTCGSACSLFLQVLQLSGEAIGFTYGGIADSAMDVASFAGGNVERYDDFWPGLALSVRTHNLIVRDGSQTWKGNYKVSSPIPFPTRAKVSFNWNMVFADELGDRALPRQFYLIPGREHINVWGADVETRNMLYRQIASKKDWRSIEAKFKDSHGQCPLEREPFRTRRLAKNGPSSFRF